MVKPDFWFMLLSEFAIGGLCIYFFYAVFLKPNAKTREEEMKERIARLDAINRSRQEDQEH